MSVHEKYVESVQKCSIFNAYPHISTIKNLISNQFTNRKKNHKSIKSVITADLKRQVWKSFKNLFVNTISFFKEVI